MTDVFSTEYDSDGFIKNNLDWRKFRESYNRVSATKLKRGIKPLPFPLLLKLFGPHKVFNTFVIDRRDVTESLLEFPPATGKLKTEEMPHGEPAVTSTLNFPGKAVILDQSHAETLLKGSKQLKRDALPPRPAFQKNSRVPGRYFPKPSTSLDEHQNGGVYESTTRERPRTQTPRSVQSITSGHTSTRGSTIHSGQRHVVPKTLRLVRGPTCKSTEISLEHGRYPPWSGKSSAATIKSVPNMDHNGFISVKKTIFNGDPNETKSDFNGLTLKSTDRSLTFSNGDFDARSDYKNDIFTTIRVKHSARQVSFPKTCVDFSAVLQGRSKTLHKRDLTESLEFAQEPRARTHVGFSGIDS